MTAQMFTRLVAEVKFLRLYTCTRCGVQRQGDTERLSIDQRFTPGIELLAAALRPDPHRMPAGWASFVDGIRCDVCKEVQQERFRVWPDGTVQALADGPAHDWMSDDFRIVMATDEEAARNSPEA